MKKTKLLMLLALPFACLSAAAFALGRSIKTQDYVVEASSHPTNYASYSYSGSYYSSISKNATHGMNGTLFTSLADLICPDGWYTYSGSGSGHLSSVLQSADEDPLNSNNMIYLYTRDSVKKNAASSWNREHVWPQSLSNGNWGTGKAGADILHIRPTYNDTNNFRGNKLYGDVSGAWTSYNGIQYCRSNNSYFEPLDSVKGDVARIVMYVYVAYQNVYSNMPKPTRTFSNYETMLRWHLDDEPDILEGNRNKFAESSKQKNRNPFVDHPEYAWQIFGDQISDSLLQQLQEKYKGEGGTGGESSTTSSSTSSNTSTPSTSSSSSSESPTSSSSSSEHSSTTSSSSSEASTSSASSSAPINPSTIWHPDSSGEGGYSEEGEETITGCGGSIIAPSLAIFALASLAAGIAFIKRKKE